MLQANTNDVRIIGCWRTRPVQNTDVPSSPKGVVLLLFPTNPRQVLPAWNQAQPAIIVSVTFYAKRRVREKWQTKSKLLSAKH